MNKMKNEQQYKKTRIRTRMFSYLKQAKKEYNEYKKHKDTLKLAEGGEKLWRAFNYYMELRMNKSLKTSREVRQAVYLQHDTNIISIYDNASWLHQFFYGWTDNIEDVIYNFNIVYNGLMYYSKNV